MKTSLLTALAALSIVTSVSPAHAADSDLKTFLHNLEGLWKGQALQKTFHENGDVDEIRYDFQTTVQRLSDDQWVAHDRASLPPWFFMQDTVFNVVGEALWAGRPGQVLPARVVRSRGDGLVYEMSLEQVDGQTMTQNSDLSIDAEDKLTGVNRVYVEGKLWQTTGFVLTR